jgi:hypothetical protein
MAGEVHHVLHADASRQTFVGFLRRRPPLDGLDIRRVRVPRANISDKEVDGHVVYGGIVQVGIDQNCSPSNGY